MVFYMTQKRMNGYIEKLDANVRRTFIALQDDLWGMRNGFGIGSATTLSSIIKRANLSQEHREECLKALICEFLQEPERHDLLLSLNLVDGYKNNGTADNRHEQFHLDNQSLGKLNAPSTQRYKDKKSVFTLVKGITEAKRKGTLDLILESVPLGFSVPESMDTKVNQDSYQDHNQNNSRYDLNRTDKNIKFPFNNLPFEKNVFFTGRNEEIKKIHDQFHSGIRMQTISGMSGSGKTQIALEYAYCFASEYDIIWWINAEDEDTLRVSVQHFLNINEHATKVDSAESERTVFIDWLNNSNKNWLLIYDNATYANGKEHELLQKYLPKNRAVGNILLTTVCTMQYDDVPLIDLDVFTEYTAKEFLQRRTKNNDDIGALSVAERLGFLPLALEQAGAYMAKNRINYEEYMCKLEKHGLKVFEDKYNENIKNYHHTVATTWKVSIEKINLSAPAKQFLCLCSYFAPDAIDFTLFTEEAESLKGILDPSLSTPIDIDHSHPIAAIIHNDKKLYSLLEASMDEDVCWIIKNEMPYRISRDLIEALLDELDCDKLKQDLIDYSLIKQSNGVLYMHKMLQEVIREEIGDDDRYVKFCLQLLEIINSKFYQNRAYFIKNIPHAISIVSYANIILRDYEIGHWAIFKESFFLIAIFCINKHDKEAALIFLRKSIECFFTEYLNHEKKTDCKSIVESMCAKLEIILSKTVFWPERYGSAPVPFLASFHTTEKMVCIKLEPQIEDAHSIIFGTYRNNEGCYMSYEESEAYLTETFQADEFERIY